MGCPYCGFVGDRATGEVYDTTYPCPRCGEGGATIIDAEDVTTPDVVVARYLRAREVKLDLPLIEGLRKDFLTLMKNLPHVQDYKTGERLHDAFRVYLTNFDELFLETFLNRDLKNDKTIDGERYNEHGRRAYWDSKLRKSSWQFYIELRGFPLYEVDAYHSEGYRFRKFQEEAPKWVNRVKSKARVFWNDMREFVEFYQYQHSQGLVDSPHFTARPHTVEQIEMEGFKVRVVGYDPKYAKDMEKFQEGLRRYRQRAAHVFPPLLQHMLPIELHGYATIEEGGRYKGSYIEVAMTSGMDIAQVIAHEMGHHLFATYLSDADQKFWYEAIRGDYGELDLEALLKIWPEKMWAFELVKHLMNSHPVLALQLDVVSFGASQSGGVRLERREDAERLVAEGVKVHAPHHPITGYAGKNAEEAFCETLGLLVDKGPGAVPEIVRHWLKLIVPSVKFATVAERVAARFMITSGYFGVGTIVLYGKYKNHRGKIVSFGQDKWGNPTIEVEPIPKGRKQNKVIGLYKIWRADVKERALAEQALQAKQSSLVEKVAARHVQALLEFDYGPAGKALSWQADFPETTPCIKCGKPATLAMVVRENFDDDLTPEEQDFATHLHPNPEVIDGEQYFWFHDCAAFAVYMCRDFDCTTATTLWNQA